MEDTWTKVSLESRDSKDTASAVILSTLPTFFWEQSHWLYWWWWCHWKLYLTDSFGRWHGRRFVVDLSLKIFGLRWLHRIVMYWDYGDPTAAFVRCRHRHPLSRNLQIGVVVVLLEISRRHAVDLSEAL